jgi:L,D-transpeptidase ErfK/SrfK
VRIINDPYVTGWRDGELYLEAHQPLAEDAARWKESLKPMQEALAVKAAETSAEVNCERANAVAREALGIPLPVSPGSRELAELLAKAPRVPSTPPWAPAQYESDALLQRSSSDQQSVTRQGSLPPS